MGNILDSLGPTLGAITGAVALGWQLFSVIKHRGEEKKQIEVALDHQPEIRQQLELGNFGEAIRHLNTIIVTQARHIDMQQERITFLETENERLRDKVAELGER